MSSLTTRKRSRKHYQECKEKGICFVCRKRKANAGIYCKTCKRRYCKTCKRRNKKYKRKKLWKVNKNAPKY